MAALKASWTKPAHILYASECPPDERTFGFAVAQAAEFRAHLIIFHASDSSDAAEYHASRIRCRHDSDAQDEKCVLESLAQRARHLHIPSEVVVRPGPPADEILSFVRRNKIDRVVMGAHSPGPVGKLLVGPVAEAVLRKAPVPVCVVGPNVGEGTFRNLVTRMVICDVSKQEASRVVANFGAGLAVKHHAGLILQHVISPQESIDVLGDRTTDQIEAELPFLVPVKLKDKVSVRTRVALGDPADELLHQGRAQQADLIVLDAQGASQFAAQTRFGTVYKVVAYAHCPVITLSPVVLARCGATEYRPFAPQLNFIAGVI